MSFDVSIKHGTLEEDLGNYTYNCHGMMTASGVRLRSINGLQGSEAAILIQHAYTWMVEHEARCRAMEPDNGWGDYEGWLGFVRKILEVCKQNPDATLTVS